MLNRIIGFSLNNRPVVLAGAVLLMVMGVYVSVDMEVDVFPDLNAPAVVVMTEAKGMAPEEVERLVTFQVETALNGAAQVRRVRSSSTMGFSVVWVEFNWGTDIYRARQIVSEKLAVVGGALPPGVGNPTLGPQSSVLGEALIVGLTADSTSLQDLRTLADRTIRPRLLATGGVAQVSVIGGEIREYQILLHPGKMKRCGISLDEVLSAVRDMNRNVSGGILYEYGNEYMLRGMLATNDVSALGRSVVRRTDGEAPVFLDDIAEVRIGNKSPRLGVASNDAKAAVLMTVTKQPDTNTLALTARLESALTGLRPSLPTDVRVTTDIFRQARFIENAIGNVQKSLYEGSLFVVIILFLFLLNVRTTLISLITIPLSLLASLLALKSMGLTINTMSLGGMAIAIGSLVDDAIVDVENVFKRLRENRQKPPEERKTSREVIYDASKEVRLPILHSTLIIIVGFVPLFFLPGMEGRMLAPLGIAFIVALCASTVIALTLTPVLCSYLLGRERPAGRYTRFLPSADKEPYWVRKLKQAYEWMLKWTLTHRKSVLSATGVTVVVTAVAFFTLGRSFLPPFNEGSFTINVSAFPGISLEESDKIGRMAERLLLSIPEIQTVGRKTGRAELDEHSLGVNVSEIEAPFAGKRSKEEIMAEIRRKFDLIPGVNVEIGQPISHRIDHMLSGTKAAIAVKLFGADLNRMFMLGNRIKMAVGDVEGLVDLNVEQQVERPQLAIRPKREMLARYGISLPEFAEIIRTLLAGETVSQVYENGQVFDLTLKVNEESRRSAAEIRNLTIDADGGRKIPLEYVADVVSSAGPNIVNRENVVRKIVISGNVSGRDMRSVVRDIRSRIEADISLPEGYYIEYGGQFESEQAASRLLAVASAVAVLAIFLLLFGQFRNALQSAIILLNLPLALIGGVCVLFFSGGEINIPALIGFISLFGIATRNGMLLLSRYNDLHREGLPARECILRGSSDRLNPILMTALTSALALAPLALGGHLPGNEIQSPMAKVILGGLLTSTLLNGFIIPLVCDAAKLYTHGRD